MSELDTHANQRFFAVINAGSSSLKYSLFAETHDKRLERRTDGGIEGIGSDKPFFIAFDDDKYQIDEYHWDKATSLDELLAFLIEWISGARPSQCRWSSHAPRRDSLRRTDSGHTRSS